MDCPSVLHCIRCVIVSTETSSPQCTEACPPTEIQNCVRPMLPHAKKKTNCTEAQKDDTEPNQSQPHVGTGEASKRPITVNERSRAVTTTHLLPH